MALHVGQPFGNFRLVRLIGEGGFGEVYLAENPLIGRRAAVKILHAALARDDELVRRFLNEARAASAIRHRNIVQVFDAGVTPEGAPYILMEFLEGMSLHKCLTDGGRLTLPRALAIADQAGSALAAAHAAGIVHRDLKPENLFLVPDKIEPGGDIVKILDFGIAKIKGGTGSGGTVQTQTGAVMGSPAYMSPEQCRDSADVDLRTDIYSFATILYEALTGRTPHVATSGTELLIMHLTATMPPLRELAPDVPAHVAAAIMRGLSRERASRFDDMAAFVGALRAVAGAPAPKPTSPSEVLPAARSKPVVHLERSPAVPGTTTFSRATGEVEAETSNESFPDSARSRRWMPFAVGGVALAGLALFLLLRPSHPPAPRAATGTAGAASASATRDRSIAPAQVGTPTEALPVAPLAHAPKADAGVTPPTAKPTRSAARKSESPPASKLGRSEQDWLAH
jgi:serine/threonine-protein kinase